MSHDVIMPALGMAQEAGRIVSWLKATGEAVAEGDALFEVETDKAVMEVPAPATGFLSGVSVGADEEAPVGTVIAQIVDKADEVGGAAHEPASTGSEAVPEAVTPVQKPEPAAPDPVPIQDPHVVRPVPKEPDGTRVLASPKARRLAAERGLDLAMLRAQGVAEPIHVEDLDLAATGQLSVLTARADAASFDAVLARASSEPDTARLFAVFAAGAWRSVFASDEPGIIIRRLDGTSEQTGGERTELSLVDLTATRLSGYMPSAGGTTVTVARDGTEMVLTLVFAETTLPLAAAAAFFEEMAARLEDPIRQLM